MKNRIFMLIICLALVSSGNAARLMNENPLIISTTEDLVAFAKSVNGGDSFRGKTVKLSADIWLNDTTGWKKWDRQTKLKSWTPIGTSQTPFEGTFDGDGHYIAGLFMKAGSETFCQGLLDRKSVV